MKTDCTKCRAPMLPDPDIVKRMHVCFRTTAYRCLKCGHWNDLKRRKGYADWDAARAAGREHG